MLYQLLVCCVWSWYLEVSAAAIPINYNNFGVIQPNTTNFTRGFQNLLQRVQVERRIYSFFLLRNLPSDCVDEQLPLNFALPVLQLNESKTVYVRDTGNSYLLAVVCIKSLINKNFLLKFGMDMQHIRTRSILAIYNENLASSTESEIVTFFKNCEQLKFLNVILIHRDFATTHVYHSFNQFPSFELETRNMRSTSPIYPNRLKDVGGKKLRTLVDQVEPMSMLFRRNKTLILEGYIGFFLKTFARRHKFSLWLPELYEPTAERVLYMEEIRQAARNGSIDVGASLSTPQKEANLHEYIYPVSFFQWLTMLPMEPTLEIFSFFIMVFEPPVIATLFTIVWLLCVVDVIQVKLTFRSFHWDRKMLWFLIIPWHLDLLRGLLCQSSSIQFNYISRRILFMLIFALGGTINSFFSTNLVNWFTVPPHEKPIEEFTQVAERNLKIQVAEADIAEIKFYRGEAFWNKYSHIFKVVKTFEEYQDNIRKLDSQYGYVMATMTWPIIEERQKYFVHPIFRLSESLYYTKGSLLSLPISENSMYKDILSDFCLRSQESGLLNFWYKKTFFAMVKLGRIDLKDPSNKYKSEMLTLKELEWVWLAYWVGIGLSGISFLLERAWNIHLQYSY
ncbi:uncharacterized protein LOC128865297 [Anastrepha ludens]|uniref:uncharacterized protein LOC128865297 n=1 Tax=Anastrepha ludens TaxID=28586 RepID=UPI0023AE9398|nr:uncharacterized protein LOC128865297 [Anastrepha ludens]